jgi:hypothetical protein
MPRARKRSGIDLGRFVEPEPLPEAHVDDLVAESELLVGAAVRLAVKNLIILGALRDGLTYDEQRYVDAARAELALLAEEKVADAARAARERASAGQRSGRAEHFHDYREADALILQRRERYSLRLATRLRELAADDEYARGLAVAARDAAWHEIADSVRAKLAKAAISVDDADYFIDRGWQLKELERDIARQLRARARELDDPA